MATRRPNPDPTADTPTFVKEGEYWTLGFDGEVRRLRDRKGLAYIANLLARPGEAVTAVELCEAPVETKEANGAVAERARLNVTRAIHAATRTIASTHPSLGLHLERTIRTGRRCVYLPDPRSPVGWRL